MPVKTKVHQPDGVLHGGATAALAESVGSAAVFVLNKDPNIQVRGIEITANHLKSISMSSTMSPGINIDTNI